MLNFLRKTALWILLLPVAIGGLGAASNQLVLIANHDKFPVMVNSFVEKRLSLKQFIAYQKAVEIYEDDKEKPKSREAAAERAATIKIIHETGMIDETHCIMTPETHLNFLADVFDFHDGTYSVGDGLLYLGEWMWSPGLLLWGFIMVDKVRKTA